MLRGGWMRMIGRLFLSYLPKTSLALRISLHGAVHAFFPHSNLPQNLV